MRKILSLFVVGLMISLVSIIDSVAEEDLCKILIEKAAGNSFISAEFLEDVTNSTIPGISTKGVYVSDIEDFEEKVSTYPQGNKEQIDQEADKNVNFIPASLADFAPIGVAKAAPAEDSLPINVEGMSFHEGKNWKSQMIIFPATYDVSQYSFLKIGVDTGYKKVNFKVQLFDDKTGAGMNQGLSSMYSLKGEGEVYIPLADFEKDYTDLKEVEGSAIHYGESAFGLPLNDANDGIITIESMDFTKKKKGPLQKIADFFGGIIDTIKGFF